ncbi:MinD/ParA family protein [Streptomyces sp. NPDC020917]|uniref:MinD/ParA family protein n=1 Tax=Streptomyces sp. NPDC020917 TaxID=3365102 RepID=UPI00379F8D69
MALITIAADKGSPGVTTTAVALAAVWPRRVLLAEADPAGGDLVYRSRAAHGGVLDPNSGMLSLAATARRGLAAEQLWDHAQPLTGGLDVLVGLGSAEQAAGLSGLWPMLGQAFATLAESPNGAADVIADCGRIGADSPTMDLFAHSSLLLLVSRTEPENLARVRDRAGALSAKLHGSQRGAAAALGQPPIGIVLIAEPGNSARIAAQVNEMLVASQISARVVGTIAYDPAGAEMLSSRRRGRLDKSLLIRSARQITADVPQRYGVFR